MFRTSYLLWFLGSINRARFSHTVIFSFNIVKYIYKPPRVNEKSKINPWFILLARRGVPCSCGKFSNFKVTSKWNFGFLTKLRINDLWCKPRTFWEKVFSKTKLRIFYDLSLVLRQNNALHQNLKIDVNISCKWELLAIILITNPKMSLWSTHTVWECDGFVWPPDVSNELI